MSEENVFSIPNADKCDCNVEYYAIGHSTMDVRVQGPDVWLRLTFSGVEFFSGKIRWHGANFRLASQDECLALLQKIQLHDFDNDRLLLASQHYKLFVVDLPSTPLHILALNGRVYPDE